MPGETQFTVTASLPFPMRINGGPFEITVAGDVVRLTLSTERHEHPDERVHGGGTFDFKEDRYGWASFTTVKAEFVAPREVNPVLRFLDALNLAIETVRDVLNLHWLHTLEEADIFRLTIGSGGAFQSSLLPGRVGAVTLPILDLSEAAKTRILGAWAAGERPQTWRLLHLDAKEALALGRHEQSVVLAWSAVEAAVRGELPRLCRAAGREPKDVWKELNCMPPRLVPYSHEQAAEHGRILDAIRLCGELCAATHDPLSLAQSGRDAYELRNRVVHQGYRVKSRDARGAWEATDFILRSLDLPSRTVPGHAFEDDNWVAHFGCAPSLDLSSMLNLPHGRVVLISEPRSWDPINAGLSIRGHGTNLFVGLPSGITEPIAATLCVLARGGVRAPSADAAYLRASTSAKDLLISGLLDNMASIASQAGWFAFNAWQLRNEGLVLEAACEFAMGRASEVLAKSPEIVRGDARIPSLATALSVRSALGGEAASRTFEAELTVSQPSLAPEVVALTEEIRKILASATDMHLVCDILRATHKRTLWLDSILVVCPREEAEYGSRKWDLGVVQ